MRSCTGYFLLLSFLSLSCPGSILAQVKQIIAGPDLPWVYEFIVDPAAEHQPTLRYRLLPDDLFQRPGNAAMSYYRALRLLNAHSEKDQKEIQDCYRFGLMIRPPSVGPNNLPLDSVSIDRVKTIVPMFADVIAELKIAARSGQCDWEAYSPYEDVSQTMNHSLGEFVATRELSRLIQQKARLAIVDGDFNEAIQLIQMSFKMGRDVARHPTVINALVGIAISIETQVLLMEMIVQPGSPNLFWSLSTIPSPFVDVRPALAAEINALLQLPILRDAEREHSPEEWNSMLGKTLELLAQVTSNNQSKPMPAKPKELEQFVSAEVTRARKELAVMRLNTDQIAMMPNIQAIALHDAMIGRARRDDLLSITHQPYYQAMPLLVAYSRRTVEETVAVRFGQLTESIGIMNTLCPSSENLLNAAIRLDCLLIRLRTIEAIRLHAAIHQNLPTKLSDIQQLPIPLNPVTGQPISYRLDDDTAVLEFPSANSIKSLGEIIRLKLRK